MTPDTRRCKGGSTRVAPFRLRAGCVGCERLKGHGENPAPGDIDPVAAWVDATAQSAGYCSERRVAAVVLSRDQVAAVDETAGI